METQILRVWSWGLAMPVPDGNGRKGRSLISLRRVVAETLNVKEEETSRFHKLSKSAKLVQQLSPPMGAHPKPYPMGADSLQTER
jgi:hypothetical protein